MKFGEASSKLLKIIKAETFSIDDTELMKLTEEENSFLTEQMRKIRESVGDDVDESVSVNYMVLKNFLNRNTRILRTYKFLKLLKIQDSVFKRQRSEDGIFDVNLEKSIEDVIEERSSEFPFLDIFEKEPPLNLYVQILTLDDCGIVMDNDMIIELKKDRIYFLKKKIVEHLINLKLVKVIN